MFYGNELQIYGPKIKSNYPVLQIIKSLLARIAVTA